MIVTELPAPDLTLLDDPSRPKGCHLSQIISSLLPTLDPKRYGKPRDEGALVKIRTGVTFERVLERGLVLAICPQAFRPDPIQRDGIWCSPDGFDPDQWAVLEYKLTWYSSGSRVCPTDIAFKPWLWQMQGYCKVMGTTTAYLWVLFVNGDYKPPKPQPPRIFKLEWTQDAIDQTWQMFVRRAKALKLI